MQSAVIKLLTFEEAADHIHGVAGVSSITPQWVRSQVDQGKLPSVTIARKRHVRVDVLDALVSRWMKLAA